MGGAVGLFSGSGSNGKSNKSPHTAGYEDALSQVANEYYRNTAPLREEFLKQGMGVLQGTQPAETLPGVQGLLGSVRPGIESQYNVARDNILASTPKGGGLTQALTNLESSRAGNLSEARTQILSDAVNKWLAQTYGGAFGAPGQAMQGLTGAAGSYASRYGSNAAAQADRYGSYVGGASSDFGNMTGGGCCFIFLAAEGHLDPVVRRYRDEHLTERNRRGYYRLADVLVPRMERSRLWKRAVQCLMVWPMTSYGRWVYGTGRVGMVFAPLAKAWLRVFDCLGFGAYRRSNGEVI